MLIIFMVGVLLCIAVGGVLFVGVSSTKTVALEYDNQVNAAANSKLEELFIFVEAKKLYQISAIGFLAIFVFTFIFSRNFIVSILMGSIVFFIPTFGVNFVKKRREKRFNQDLPDALQSTANMLRSGLNLVSSLEFIVEDGKGPIAQEFGLFLRELKVGISFDQALDNMYKRMPLGDLQLVVAGMKISREVGGSLADVLARLADTIRRRVEMEGKIDSLTSMGKLQGVVMTLLPVGVGYAIYKIEPEAMSKLVYHWTGWICMTVIIILELMGYFTIRKIVNIDV